MQWLLGLCLPAKQRCSRSQQYMPAAPWSWAVQPSRCQAEQSMAVPLPGCACHPAAAAAAGQGKALKQLRKVMPLEGAGGW